jgi:D-3-phosphoglycerate dehydrogenase
MAFKVVRTFAMPANEYEQEVLGNIGATMEVASFALRSVTEEELLSFCRDADAIISVLEPFTRSVIERLEKCRVIANIGVGYDSIDIEAATDCGVCVVNNPEYCLEEVSDHALALLLSLARKITTLDKAIRAGKTGYRDLAQVRGRVFRLRGQTLGLVGLGGIARTLIPKARGFGFRIIACSPHLSAEVAEAVGVEMVDFGRLLEESDFISIHAALTPENEGMFGLEQFKRMKPTAFLINTARGALVDTGALHTALSEGLIAGAGLDVTEPEPINPDNPLLKLENVIFTGHSAYFSETSVVEQRKGPVEEIARVLSGEWPRALVNPRVKEKFAHRWGRP